jgi:hypothetical protein
LVFKVKWVTVVKTLVKVIALSAGVPDALNEAPEYSITNYFIEFKVPKHVFKDPKSVAAVASIVRAAVSKWSSEVASQLATKTVLATS